MILQILKQGELIIFNLEYINVKTCILYSVLVFYRDLLMFKILYCIISKGEEGITDCLVFVFFMTRGRGRLKIICPGRQEG